jgi:single-stranded DNA-binding protein
MTQTPTKTKVESIWNEVTFTGNLGRDPEMSYTPMAKPVQSFR